MQRKCCVHCPGDVTRTGEPAREHACEVPGYVAGSLRLASMKPNAVDASCCCSSGPINDAREKDVTTSSPAPKLQSQGSCYERFATAKKFHTDNLQHKQLPDRVDDAIFTKDAKPRDTSKDQDSRLYDAVKRCQKIIPRRNASRNKKRELNRVHRYAPALGCKKPTTYMDLAICWETPVDETYEPPRPSHVDGSDGGPAPAIFNLVQHDASQVDLRDGGIPARRPECYGTHRRSDECDKCARQADSYDPEIPNNDDQLCRDLGSITLSSPKRIPRPPVGAAARKKRAEFLQHCASNVGHDVTFNKLSPIGARSASCLRKRGCAINERNNNGLQVPRPRTPYARRSFCIDTLTPPFSIVNGCRETDYPEHWRLTSIYQQSYRNPKKMREGRTLIGYDRPFV